MRKLTLGAVILGVGVLAASPFRRLEPILDATSDVPEQASGPTISELSGSSLEMLVDDMDDSDQIPVLFASQTQPVAQNRSKTFSAPLSYEDLAVPIADDSIHHQAQARNFSATVPSQERLRSDQPGLTDAGDHGGFTQQAIRVSSGDPSMGALESSRYDDSPLGGSVLGAPLDAPRTSSPHSTQRPATRSDGLQTQSARQSVGQSAGGRFASTQSNRTREANRTQEAPPLLPEAGEEQRPRHWIRQPVSTSR